MVIFNYIRKFFAISFHEKFLFIYGMFVSLFYRVIVQYVPLKFYFKLLNSKSNHILSANIEPLLLMVDKTILRLKTIAPWKINCLNEALSRKYLLEYFHIKSNIVLSIIKKEDRAIAAHASLLVKDKIVFNYKWNQRNICIID